MAMAGRSSPCLVLLQGPADVSEPVLDLPALLAGAVVDVSQEPGDREEDDRKPERELGPDAIDVAPGRTVPGQLAGRQCAEGRPRPQPEAGDEDRPEEDLSQPLREQ